MSDKKFYQYALYTLLVTAVIAFSLYLYQSYYAITTDAELNYGEGILLQQYTDFFNGKYMSPLEEYPYIVYHYPPVYYLVTGLINQFIESPLLAGRLVSIISVVGISTLIIFFTFVILDIKDKRTKLLLAIISGLLPFTISAFTTWTNYMRVDSLAILFGLAGMVLGWSAIKNNKLIILSSIFFVLAVFTKQTLIAPAAATFIILLIINHRLAIRGISICIFLGLLILAVMYHYTNGEIINHMFLYNINRFEMKYGGVILLKYLIINLLFLLCFFIYLYIKMPFRVQNIISQIKESRQSAAISLLSIYMIINCVIIGTIFKVGADRNYLLEITVGISIFMAFVFQSDIIYEKSQRFYLFILVLLHIVSSYLFLYTNIQHHTDKNHHDIRKLIALVKQHDGMVYSENMTILMLADKQVPWEPAIITELIHKKKFDELKVVNMVRNHQLELLIFTTFGKESESERYTLLLAKAIKECYYKERAIDKYDIYVPKEKCTSTVS